jgi:hypothetical protein
VNRTRDLVQQVCTRFALTVTHGRATGYSASDDCLRRRESGCDTSLSSGLSDPCAVDEPAFCLPPSSMTLVRRSFLPSHTFYSSLAKFRKQNTQLPAHRRTPPFAPHHQSLPQSCKPPTVSTSSLSVVVEGRKQRAASSSRQPHSARAASLHTVFTCFRPYSASRLGSCDLDKTDMIPYFVSTLLDRVSPESAGPTSAGRSSRWSLRMSSSRPPVDPETPFMTGVSSEKRCFPASRSWPWMMTICSMECHRPQAEITFALLFVVRFRGITG